MSKLTVSVLKDTNRIVASSEAELGAVRPGSYIRLGTDKNFYIINKTQKIYFIKDFEVIAPNAIKINSDVGINLLQGDTLTLSYKEYELKTLLSIENSGVGYRVGDILIPNEGIPSYDPKLDQEFVTKFRVEAVDTKGGILSLSFVQKGKYVEKPKSVFELRGGSGANASICCEYSLIDNRSFVEQEIDIIDSSEHVSATIRLMFPLPRGVKNGKLSIEKWEMYLNSNYLEESKFNSKYEITRDFTPILNLPLMTDGSFSTKIIYNQSMQSLENEIVSLREQVAKLMELVLPKSDV